MERSSRGRQSEARRNDTAVLDAARLVFAVHGPDAPVSAVAAEAGVGMATLYRRYASKEALFQQLCLDSLAQQIEAGEAALAQAGDSWAALAEYIRTCVSFRAGVFASLAGAFRVTAELQASADRSHDLLEQLVVRAGRDGRARRAGRGGRAGELRPDISSVDIHRLIELFSRGPADNERLLHVALEGLRAPGHDALPGAPPSWEGYVTAWSHPQEA